MRELERRYPTPSFYPAGRGAADALAWWAEKTMFLPAVSIVFAKRPDVLPEGFLEDRAKFSGRNIDPVAMMAAVPNLLDQLRAHFDWLDQMLADGRSFLQGPAAGLADLAAYHPVWYLRQNFGSAAAPLDGFPRLLSWAERIAAIGHGRRSQMTSQQALDVGKGCHIDRQRDRRSAEIPSAGNLARPLPSRRTILDATRSSVNWSPRASMRSSSDAVIPRSARFACIFHAPALS